MVSLKKNAVLNVIQNVCKILFPLLTIPYASRILGPDSYGKVSYGNSIVRYFILLAALGIATYSQREAPSFRDDREKINAFASQVFTINVWATALSYTVLIALLLVSVKLKEYTMVILIQSSAILLTTLGADYINVIYEDYFFITVRYAVMQCVSLAMLYLFVRTPSDYCMYAVINVIATTGGNLFNIFYIRRYVKLRLVHLKTCVRHLKPILLLFCVSITTVIYVSSDITILGHFMSDADVGIYTMASNIYSVVKQVISAVIVVSIPRMSYYLGNAKEEEYRNLARKVFNALIALLLPTIVGLAFLSREALMIMGGKEFVSGQPTLIALSTALLFAVLAGFYSNGYLLLVKKDKTYFFATVLSAVTNIGLNFILIPRIGILGAAITTLIAEIIMTGISGYNGIKQYSLLVDGRTIWSALLGSFVIAIVCYGIKLFALNPILTVAISVSSGAILYCIIMYLTNKSFAEFANQMIIKVLLRNRRGGDNMNNTNNMNKNTRGGV